MNEQREEIIDSRLTNLVTKVCRLSHMTEQSHLHHPCKHFDLRHSLSVVEIVKNREIGFKPERRVTLTVYGSFILSKSNGASMTKFPLSVTTGPAEHNENMI